MKYNLIIRPVNIIKDHCSGEIKTHTMKPKDLTRLYRYLNKYFRYHWQEVKPDCKKCNPNDKHRLSWKYKGMKFYADEYKPNT